MFYFLYVPEPGLDCLTNIAVMVGLYGEMHIQKQNEYSCHYEKHLNR